MIIIIIVLQSSSSSKFIRRVRGSYTSYSYNITTIKIVVVYLLVASISRKDRLGGKFVRSECAHDLC